MASFSRLVNVQGHVAGDGPNGHVHFSCLEVVVAARCGLGRGEGRERTV